MIKHLTYLYIILSLLSLSACKKNPIEQPAQKHLIAELPFVDHRLRLYSDQEILHVGYNRLYFEVSGKSNDLQFHPVMDMHTLTHSCPSIQPAFDATSQLYEGAAVFTMPSGEMGSWTLQIHFNGEEKSIPVQIQPAKEQTRLVSTHQAQNGKRYVLALVDPMQPKIGLNDLSILIYEQKSMHEFVPVEDLVIQFEPIMPSMGHGSPNNTAPSHLRAGLYKGKVNFTMSGDWRLQLQLFEAGEKIVAGAYFDLWF